MEPTLILLVAVIVLALAFDAINGFHDAANAIATVVSTRVLTPKVAVIFGAVLNLVGALLGTEVAATVGKGIVESSAVSMPVVLCALVAAIIWNLITWVKGLPSSSSHALIGSLIGAVLGNAAFGAHAVKWQALSQKVLIPMVISPLAGLAIGYGVMLALTWLVHKWPLPIINNTFGKLQIVSAGFMALSHGHNDAQKSMGIIALALYTAFPQKGFSVDTWVVLACALAMGIGTLSGGWKIIRTLGSKMIKLQPIHGFAAETAASATIMAASHWGIPLSTTHVISSSIMGVGITKRLSALKLPIVGSILIAWVLTIPVTVLLAAALMGLWQWAFGA
ncbi:MAG: inorganic phosphate transporter [Vampirovibrionales bacterium]|nr:inorganic phosphate transporter [Vampirovibrionales bacterium]